MTSPDFADTDDSSDGTDIEPTPKNLHPGEATPSVDPETTEAASETLETDTEAASDDWEMENAPLFPPEFDPDDDPYLAARVERLADPHQDDLVLWVLRHYFGLNSTEMADYLDVHRTTVRDHMKANGEDRVFVPYKPCGLHLVRGLSYSDADRAAVEDDFEMLIPANDGKPVVVDDEKLDAAVASVEEAMNAAADEFDSPHPTNQSKFGVEIHVGAWSLDVTL